jgi:hypothetical protein
MVRTILVAVFVAVLVLGSGAGLVGTPPVAYADGGD